MQMQGTVTFLVILFLPYVVPTEVNLVYQYGPHNFKNQIEQLEGNFIMFYTPWCSHCTQFHPIWFQLGERINTPNSKYAIAQIDCSQHRRLCHENDITGYPTLLYFHKNSFSPIEYEGIRDIFSLSLFLNEIFTANLKDIETEKSTDEVKIYNGMAYFNDFNIEKFISQGQHFILFYASWCKASQNLAPIWADLAVQYEQNQYIQIGHINCVKNELTCRDFDVKQYPYLVWMVSGRIMGVANEHTLEGLQGYVEKMLLAENHDPNKFMKKKKALPVARISEETFETFLQKELVFVNYFSPWCAHCMQLNPLWLKLGEQFQNETRVIIADVDCGRSKTICEAEKINGLPTLILYKNKEIVSVENGGQPLDSLISLVNEHLEDFANKPEDNISNKDKLPVTKDEL